MSARFVPASPSRSPRSTTNDEVVPLTPLTLKVGGGDSGEMRPDLSPLTLKHGGNMPLLSPQTIKLPHVKSLRQGPGKRKQRRFENDHFLLGDRAVGNAKTFWLNKDLNLSEFGGGAMYGGIGGDGDDEPIRSAFSTMSLREEFFEGEVCLQQSQTRRGGGNNHHGPNRQCRRNIKAFAFARDIMTGIETLLLAASANLHNVRDEVLVVIPTTQLGGIATTATVERESSGKTRVEVIFTSPLHRLLAHNVARFHQIASHSHGIGERVTVFHVPVQLNSHLLVKNVLN